MLQRYNGTGPFLPLKLSTTTMKLLPENIQKPSYNPADVKIGIVHLGPGKFFQAHGAVYIDDILNTGDLRWGICAANIRSDEAKKILEHQNNLYTLVERDGGGEKARVIGSIVKTMCASEDPEALVRQMADPDVKLVTMTITEKGYKRNGSAMDRLSASSDALRYVVAALETRMKNGIAPFTAMSCDNMPGNGTALRTEVLAYAAEISSELHDWISNEVSFPSTMVDRITPSKPEDKVRNSENMSDNYGVTDTAAVATERFRCWVIEDNFCNDVPDFSSISDVVVTKEPLDYELMKIRTLNGGHVAVGVIGHMLGHQLVRDAMADPQVNTFVKGFIDQSVKTLPNKVGVNLDSYAPVITRQRIENPYLEDGVDRLPRNAVEGKLQNRVLATTRDLIANGESIDHHAFVVAGWMEYVKGFDSLGKEFDISDKKAIDTGVQALAQASGNDASQLLKIKEIFNGDLSQNNHFISKVSQYFADIADHGMRQALKNFHQEQLDHAPKRELSAVIPSALPDMRLDTI